MGKLGLDLQQKQELRLLPQIIQRTEILALPTLELNAKIEHELLENPVLELDMLGPEKKEKEREEDKSDLEKEVGVRDEKTTEAQAPAEPDETGGNGSDNEAEAEADEIRLNNLEASLDEYFSSGPRYSYSSDEERDSKMDALANTPAENDNFYEALLEQLGLMELDPDTFTICRAIVYRLDESGFFKSDFSEIEKDIEGEVELYPGEAEDCLKVVQKLEPKGVGARDLRECLLLQVDDKDDIAPLVKEIITNFFDDLAKNRLPVIARGLSVPVEKVNEAVNYISHLSPSPLQSFSAQPADVIVPDVTVYRRPDSIYDAEAEGVEPSVHDIYEVEVREGLASHVKRNPLYDSIMKSLKSKKDKEFLREKIESAKLLLRAIEERGHTLERIAWKIVERQSEFLEDGVEKLRPMKMKEIADELGLHVATISRATKGKYIQTPQGVYPFKFFFTSAAKSDGDEDQSVLAVKKALRQVIDDENKQKPFSDQQIVKELEKKGFEVARRTVVKYRKQLSLPSSRERREYVSK